MIPALTLANCSFPTTFEALWQVAAFCGVMLLITTSLLFWQNRLFKHWSNILLMRGTLVGSIWAFALAFVTSRNYLICAGVPGAPPALVQSANASYQTLLVFQSVVRVTCALTFTFVLIGVFSMYFTYRWRCLE